MRDPEGIRQPALRSMTQPPFARLLRAYRAALSMSLIGALNVVVAQERFPSLAIEIIVPFGPGGSDDAMSRRMAPLIQRELSASVFVTNIAGHSGNAGLTKLLVNPPDGYTVAVLSSETIAGWASDVGYARPDDFMVLGVVQESPSMLFTPATAAPLSFSEFLAAAKENPNATRVATAGAGTTDDLVIKMLGAKGYPVVNAPFSKPLDRYAALSTQRAHAIFEEPAYAGEFTKARQWRPLVVVDTVRSPLLPDVPAISEFGFPAANLRNFRMLVVRSKTPPDRVKLLTESLARSLASPEWKQYCESTHTCANESSAQEASMRMRTFYRDVETRFTGDSSVQPPRQ